MAIKKRKLKGKKDVCTVGLSCGVACITRSKQCRKKLQNLKSQNLAKGFRDNIKVVAGGAGGGGGVMTPQQRKLIDAAESKIRNNKNETGVLVDENGKILWKQKGNENSVDTTGLNKLSDAEKSKAVLTHNHPEWQLSKGGKVIGGSFSPEDVVTAAQHNLKAIRAADQKYNYELKPKEGETWPRSQAELQFLVDRRKQIWQEEYDKAFFKSEAKNEEFFASEEADKLPWKEQEKIMEQNEYEGRIEALHKTNERLAETFFLEYTREEI